MHQTVFKIRGNSDVGDKVMTNVTNIDVAAYTCIVSAKIHVKSLLNPIC